MNLLELIKKSDRNVQVQVWDAETKTWGSHGSPTSLFSRKVEPRIKFIRWRPHMVQDTFRGLSLRSGMRIVVKNAGYFWPSFASGEGVFKFCSIGETKVLVVLGWSSEEREILSPKMAFTVSKRLISVSVPASEDELSDLVIYVPSQNGAKLFLGVHRVLDRSELFYRCKGNGLEIGPGPKPQIFPGAATEVKYIEQSTPDRWEQLYDNKKSLSIDPKLWNLYVVGNADNIPALPASLDFIFSSHVIEHLANPLGHLTYWASLLRPGGVVAAVIPDRDGCKDYVFLTSTLEELEAEYAQKSMSPSLDHYRRWAAIRAPKMDPLEIMQSGRSIHVHFYTPKSLRHILTKTYERLGFRKFEVISENNHKDFFVILEK